MSEFQFYLKQNSIKAADVTFDWLRVKYQLTKLLKALLATLILQVIFFKISMYEVCFKVSKLMSK